MKTIIKDYLKELDFEIIEEYNLRLHVENDEIYYEIYIKNITELNKECKFISLEEILVWMYQKIKK